MKEKLKNAFSKIGDFLDDHGDQVAVAAMTGFYIIVGVAYGSNLHLQNKEKRLQIKALRKK